MTPNVDENLRIVRSLGALTISFLGIILMVSCSSKQESVTPGGTSVTIDSVSTVSTAPEGSTATAYNADDLLSNSTFSSTVTIGFSSSINITNPLSAKGVAITESNGDVVINSTASNVEYILSGTTANGSVKVYSDKKFKLTLNGVNITNADGPAINIQSGKRAFVVLNDGTTNTLADGANYATSTTEDMKGTFFSEGQVIFTGNGSLSIKSAYKHAICSDDYIRIISGNITVTGTVSDGIHTKDAFIVDGGTLGITASSDGIECEAGYIVINNGTFTINAVGKGIAATYDTDNTIDPFLTINGGTINITSSGSEGIESKSVLTVNNGNITTNTKDDGLNAKTFVYINGGTLYIYSTSNDGIDSNGKLTITGGKVIAVGSTAPEEGFDCDNNTFKISGGILIGIGGATSQPTANVSTQASVILGAGTANQVINVQSVDGTETLTFMVPRAYSTMLFSSPKLKQNKSYTVSAGGSVANGKLVNGLYTSGTYSGGTQSTTFTTSSLVTKVGGSVGPG